MRTIVRMTSLIVTSMTMLTIGKMVWMNRRIMKLTPVHEEWRVC